MWSLRAAGAAVGVLPTTVRRWIDQGLLKPDPPWTVGDLQLLRYRAVSAGRRVGSQADHGTLARYTAGCSCRDCRAASAARQRRREAAKTEAGLDVGARARILELVNEGQLLNDAAAAVGVTARKVLRTMDRHPDWAVELQAALDTHRPPDWAHGRRSAFRAGCRCGECLEALRRSANRP